ncbi:mechanosensitive ion channel [Candidatus Saccharibacteria bacterium]|nr:mechanosensitive ion channel [Candidatus Saccharibacteria bacterium]
MQDIPKMWNELWSGVPNVIQAFLVLILAFFAAWVAKKAIIKLLQFVGFAKLLNRAGLDDEGKRKTIDFVAQLVYLVAFVSFMPGIFQILGLTSIASPITEMMHVFAQYMPSLIAAIVLLVVAGLATKIIYLVLSKVFEAVGIDKGAQKVLEATGTQASKNFSLSKTLAATIRYIALTIFVVEAFDILKFDILSKVGHSVVAYLPLALSAIAIIIAAILLGNFAYKAITENFKESKASAFVAKVAIIVIGVFITLYQLGIAPAMVNSAFIIILGAIGVAFAIAFGIGGREFAQHMLAKLSRRIDGKNGK